MTHLSRYIVLATLVLSACGQQKSAQEAGAALQDTLALPGESLLPQSRNVHPIRTIEMSAFWVKETNILWAR
ncbi:MAG: hypothetical protein IH600_00955 [Bacteroidetes bacterium]|nr:hypothetical protein [Bacteroidota bacterium]